MWWFRPCSRLFITPDLYFYASSNPYPTVNPNFLPREEPFICGKFTTPHHHPSTVKSTNFNSFIPIYPLRSNPVLGWPSPDLETQLLTVVAANQRSEAPVQIAGYDLNSTTSREMKAHFSYYKEYLACFRPIQINYSCQIEFPFWERRSKDR